MQCHKCEWSGRLGEFADRPWEEVPCARCEYHPEAQTRYVLPVDEDALGEDATAYGAMRTSSFASRGCEMPPEYRLNDQSAPCPVSSSLEGVGDNCSEMMGEMPGPEVMDALGRVVDLLLRLTTKQHVVLRLRLAGKSFKEIGTELGVSGNAAEKVFGHLLRARPLLKSLFPRRVVRGARRRAAGLHPAELCRGEG